MKAKRTLPRSLLLGAALVVVILAAAVERAMRPAPVGRTEDLAAAGPHLLRAMSFIPPAEPKQ